MKKNLTIICLFLWTFALAAAVEPLKCDICGALIQGKYFYREDDAVGGRKIICTNCETLPDRCFICGLPVKEGFETLPDGRIVCARDAKEVIASEEEARQVGQTVQYDLDRLLSRFMTFPGTNMLVSIVNKFYLENLFKNPGAGQACVSIYGATCSNPLPGNKVVHSVAVLSYLRKSRLMAVYAHEFTHAWMGENVTHERTVALDKNTLEGFCEFIAYKYMQSRDETFEMANIRKNQYTHGQIDVLIAADEKYGFDAVLEWLKAGDDGTLKMDALERVRAVSGRYVASSASPALYVAPTALKAAPAPDTLVLKGISGSGAHRFALINNATFEVMESGKVRLAQTNVMVRCLEIGKDSVTIQIAGSNEKKQLFLRATE
jgi:hypothetical protein